MARQLLCLVALIILESSNVNAGTFLVEPPFISFAINEDSILHPFFYLGSGGERVVRVCILPTSDFIDQMTPGLLRAIDTFNALEATTENFVLTSKEVPATELDFESFAIHELMHCAGGIGHSNALAGTAPPDLSTNSLVGDNGAFNINPGDDTFLAPLTISVAMTSIRSGFASVPTILSSWRRLLIRRPTREICQISLLVTCSPRMEISVQQ